MQMKEDDEGFDSIPYLLRGCIVAIEFRERRGADCLFYAVSMFMAVACRGKRAGARAARGGLAA
jgi:hypothetical protein